MVYSTWKHKDRRPFLLRFHSHAKNMRSMLYTVTDREVKDNPSREVKVLVKNEFIVKNKEEILSCIHCLYRFWPTVLSAKKHLAEILGDIIPLKIVMNISLCLGKLFFLELYIEWQRLHFKTCSWFPVTSCLYYFQLKHEMALCFVMW